MRLAETTPANTAAASLSQELVTLPSVHPLAMFRREVVAEQAGRSGTGKLQVPSCTPSMEHDCRRSPALNSSPKDAFRTFQRGDEIGAHLRHQGPVIGWSRCGRSPG